MLVVVLVFLVVLCVAIWDWVRVKENIPPLAAGALPLVGHSFMLLRNKDRLFDIVLEDILGSTLKRGNECATIQLGTWRIFVIMNPEDASVLAASCLQKDMTYDFFIPLFDKGLINAEVSTWKKHRKLLNPTFHQTVLNEYLSEYNKESRELVKAFAKHVGEGPFDQMDQIKHSTFLLIMTTVVGVAVREHENIKEDVITVSKSFHGFTDCMVERVRKCWYHSDFIFNLSNLKKKQYEFSHNINDFVYKIIRKKKEQRKAQKESPDEVPNRFQGFLDLLIEMNEAGDLTDEEVKDEVNTFVVAGSDTIAQVLTMSLLNLGSYPEVQEKVVEELMEVFEGSDRDVDKDDLCKLVYLEAALKETMRLYPIIAGFGRVTDSHLKLKKYTLPAGSRCFVSIYSICRHQLWGSDATVFRPERWLNGNTLPDNLNAFSVFSLGRRNCIGSKYAMMSMKTTLAHLLRRYKVTGDVTKLVRRLDVVVRPVSGYHVSLEQRTFE